MADEVLSVIYQIAAKLAATVAKIEIACPHQIIAIVAIQLEGKGLPAAFTSVAGFWLETFFLDEPI